MPSFIFTQHVILRARERFRRLRDIAPEDLRAVLLKVAETGELIPSVMRTHEMRRSYLLKVAGGVIDVVTAPRPGTEEIILAIDHEANGSNIVTVFDKTMDIPEAEVDHPRKYSPLRKRA